MRLHPHNQWTTKYPSLQPAKKIPKIVAKKFYLETNRLYARTSNLFIRKRHLPPQSHLNDRQTQLQEYLTAERETRGNGSPLHSNPQQVFTFSATDEVPINTVLSDGFLEFVDPLLVPLVDECECERELELGDVMIPEIALSLEGAYQRMVDGKHRRMVRSLVGPAFDGDLDLAIVMRTERCLSAQGF